MLSVVIVVGKCMPLSPNIANPGCLTLMWITNGPFLSEFEAKRWFRLESKVTVRLHNSALHQRAMNPIPSDWPWLNTGNGYPSPTPTLSLPGPSKASPAMSALAPAAISLFFSGNKTLLTSGAVRCLLLLPLLAHTFIWIKLPNELYIEEVVQKGSQVMKSNSYGLLALFFIYELFIISYLN